jgi:long-chain acyl-CoA synthetase
MLGMECEAKGVDLAYSKPGKDDIAVIMYTSGSTGQPKGVMLSHLNLITSLKTVIKRLGTIKLEKDIYIAYLPLAHVLELCCELGCLLNGIRLAYSSSKTIADNSTGIKFGQKGDLRILKPTIMAAVPVVLERLRRTVHEKLLRINWLKQLFFKYAFQQKLLFFRAGMTTTMLDRILFRRIASAVVGGKLRLMVVGGALLSKEVHEFTQVTFPLLNQLKGISLPFELNNAYQVNIKVSTREK